MVAAPRPMPLLGDHFERKPKRVHLANSFRDLTGQAANDPYKKNLIEFRSRITQGLELPPRFYRNGVGSTPDDLLALTGVKHIHLGDTKSDVLLFVMEFDSYVVLLEIANHVANFNQIPVGDTLMKHHINPLQPDLLVWEQVAQAAALAESKALSRGASLAAARAKGRHHSKGPKAPE